MRSTVPLFTRLLRAGETKMVKRLGKIAAHIDTLEQDAQKLTDAELRAKTDEFRARYADGESLDELLPEAFAAVREAFRRTTGDEVTGAEDGLEYRQAGRALAGRPVRVEVYGEDGGPFYADDPDAPTSADVEALHEYNQFAAAQAARAGVAMVRAGYTKYAITQLEKAVRRAPKNATYRKALAEAREGDVVVLAGKGHETYQILKDRTIAFDDREVARAVLHEMGYSRDPKL